MLGWSFVNFGTITWIDNLDQVVMEKSKRSIKERIIVRMNHTREHE